MDPNDKKEIPKDQDIEEMKGDDDEGKGSYYEANWDESVDKFDDMGLKEEVLRGIYGYGFNKPSPIQ